MAINLGLNLRKSPVGCPRAEKLFRQNENEVHQRTDRLFACLMVFQWLVGVLFGVVISPVAWEGAKSSIHPHVWMALILGGLISSLPIALAVKKPGWVVTRHTIAIAQALTSALFIHLMGGRIETHFHVFGSLAFLAFYRDWRVLISASAIVAIDHLLRGAYIPFSVYGEVTGAHWRWLEHAGWVIFEDIFLFIGIAISLQEMRTTADRQAELEHANATIQEATSQLEHKTSLLNAILEDMGEGVIATNADGKIILSNSATNTILGRDFLHVPSSEWTDRFGVFTEEGQPHCSKDSLPLASSLRGESVDSMELLIKRGDFDPPVWIEVSARPLRASAGRDVGGGLVVFREITERKRLMEEMQKAQATAENANRAKSEFLSRMSHELRTPLNSVIGFSQLIQMEDLSVKSSHYLARIQQAGHHLLDLINEVLDIARIEVGRISLSSEPVLLEDAITNAVEMLRPFAGTRNIDVQIVSSGADIYVKADRQRLSQILLNLISNAIKYNREEGSLTISAWQTADNAFVNVVDTGNGISPNQVHKLFQPFERLGAEQQPIEGTGLGLAVSKGLAEAMEGRLYLKSSSSLGTTFELSLVLSDPPLRAAEPVLVGRSFSADRAATVLLVEDNPTNIYLMEQIFKTLPGMNLHVVQRAADAVIAAQKLVPDLILLDLHLPDQPGSWVLQCVRETPGCQSVPVVVVSADATDGERKRLLAMGASAYITKPFNVKELLAVVQSLLQQQRPAA